MSYQNDNVYSQAPLIYSSDLNNSVPKNSVPNSSDLKNSDDIYISSKGVWKGLVIFLILMLLIITMFYAYSLAVLVDPESIPLAIGAFGVEAGLKGEILNICPEVPSSVCQFNVASLKEATDKCITDSGRCSAFYFDGSTMQYTVSTPLAPSAVGGTYVRQYPISQS